MTRVRLGVLGFCCTLSLITYLDRVCIMRVQEDIRDDLELSSVQMGFVFSAFLLGYALFEVPGGWLGDRWGPRRVLARIVLWWSAFTALTGAVFPFALPITPYLVLDAFLAMLLVRFLFGAGEAGAYPNLSRVVGVWFPYRERARAQGAIWMSARLGGAIAPFVIGRLAAVVGWRMAFVALGVIGIVWCVAFLLWFRDTPARHPACSAEEREEIADGAIPPPAAHDPLPWGEVLRQPTMWALCVAAFGVSFGWYFYPTWQPKYLKDVYDLSYADSELLTGLPFLCGAAGCLVGGGVSDWLVRRTGSRRWGRSLVGLFGFTGAGLCVLATGFVTQPWQAVGLLCLAFFINDLAIPTIWAVSADVGGRYAGTIAGVMNMVGAFGGLLSPTLIPVAEWALNDLPEAVRWQAIFAGLSGAWFVAAAAWLFIDAGRPLVRDGVPRNSPNKEFDASGEHHSKS